MNFSLLISSKTWLKDAFELIDYDCEILVTSTLNVKNTSYVYRDDNDKEKLMKINVYNNKKNIFFEFERNKYELDETNNIITPNTSWFFLKPSKMDSKMNRYKLTQGDIIRIGRITMRIRDIKFVDNKKDDK